MHTFHPEALSTLEIPASQVFLGADAQLLWTSLVGARMPLSICIKSRHKLNIHLAQQSALWGLAFPYHGSWIEYIDRSKLWPLAFVLCSCLY